MSNPISLGDFHKLAATLASIEPPSASEEVSQRAIEVLNLWRHFQLEDCIDLKLKDAYLERKGGLDGALKKAVYDKLLAEAQMYVNWLEQSQETLKTLLFLGGMERARNGDLANVTQAHIVQSYWEIAQYGAEANLRIGAAFDLYRPKNDEIKADEKEPKQMVEDFLKEIGLK